MIDQVIQTLAAFPNTGYPIVNRFAPGFVASVLCVALSWLLASGARWAALRATKAEWLEHLLLRSAVFSGLVEPSLTESRTLLANTVYWSILLIGAASALALFNDHVATQLTVLILIFLPNALLGLAIILGAWWLGRFWGRAVLIRMANSGVPYPWRWAFVVRIFVVLGGAALASESTGFATILVRSTFLILLAGFTLAAAHASLPILREQLLALFSTNGDNAEEHLDDHLLR